MSLDTLVCPTDCSFAVPVVEFSDCAPATILGQINKIYIGNQGQPLVNWADPAEWASRIDNSSTAVTAIRELTVIGAKPQPERNAIDISNNRTAYGNTTHTINFTIDDNTDTNYEWMRYTECNGQYQIWYETIGGKLYGGNEGVTANLNAWEENPEDPDSFATIVGVLTWKTQNSPIRIDSPIA